METNAIPALVEVLNHLQQAAPAVQSAENAWRVIYAGGGAALIHSYHMIKDAGGFRAIARNLIGSKLPTPALPNPKLTNQSGERSQTAATEQLEKV